MYGNIRSWSEALIAWGEDSQKLTRASFDIAKPLAGPLRTNFLDRFVWGGSE